MSNRRTSSRDNDLQPGTRLGRYEIRQTLGQGGMGTVYRARDTMPPLAGREVAIKVLLSTLFGADSLQRFLGEAHALSRFEHPNIVRIIDCVVEDDRPFIVMECLKGEDLSKFLERTPVEIERAVDIILGVCAGVSACHRRGIIHRDLKPENVFLHRPEPDLEIVKLLDFGVSKSAIRPDLTNDGSLPGTLRYMSPEQARGLEADARSDQYAIALLLHVLLVRRKPFADLNKPSLELIARGLPERTQALRPDVPDDLDSVIARALHLDPASRFESVHELGSRLLPFASENGRYQWTRLFTSAPPAELPGLFTAPIPVNAAEPAPSSGSLNSTTISEINISTARKTAPTSLLRTPPSGAHTKSIGQAWFEQNPSDAEGDHPGARIDAPTPSAPPIALEPQRPRPPRRNLFLVAAAAAALAGSGAVVAITAWRTGASSSVQPRTPSTGTTAATPSPGVDQPAPSRPATLPTAAPEPPPPPAVRQSAPMPAPAQPERRRADTVRRKKPQQPVLNRTPPRSAARPERDAGIEYTDKGSPIIR